MTNDIKISRELAERLAKTCMFTMLKADYEELRALLAAPVVERQEPVACSHEWTDDGEFMLICTKCGLEENHEPYGWVQTRGDAINNFTQEWDVVQEWEDNGFEYKAMFDHTSPPEPVAVELTDDQLIEVAKMSAALCSEQHTYMDRALHLDWQPHKWVIDAMRKVKELNQ